MLDLLIKDGFVVDGTGLDRYRADVGVSDGRIVSIGKIKDSGDKTDRLTKTGQREEAEERLQWFLNTVEERKNFLKQQKVINLQNIH